MLEGSLRFGLLAILMITTVSALTIVPSMTNIEDDYSKRHDFVITVVNDGAKFENIRMTVDPYSTYLSKYITIEPKSFTLLANEKKNIQLSTRFPKNLSPEKHDLLITAFTEDGTGPSSIYSFTVEGTPIHNLRIDDVLFDNVSNKESLYITLSLDNRGNVIARSYPTVEFISNGEIVDTIQYKSLTMLLPGKKMNLTLGYDSSTLDPGIYTIHTELKYSGDHQTNKIQKSLEIKEKTSRDESIGIIGFIKDNMFFIIFLVIVAIGSRILYAERKTLFERHLEKTYGEHGNIEARMDKIDVSVKTLVDDIHDFVEDSNRWLAQKYGEKRYEFR